MNISLKRKSSALVLLLTLALLSSSLCTFTVECKEEFSEVAGLNLQAYAPARIFISYAYTNNFSVTDVSSMGKSLYKITSGPTSIEFKAEETDRYTFTVEIKYAAIVTQSIQIAIFSSNYAPEGIQFNVKGDTVRIQFTLTVTEEPRYPTAQEVAEQVVLQVANELSRFETQTNKIVELQNRNLTTQWILIIFNLTVNVAALVVLLLWVRPRQEKRRLQ